MSIEKQPQHITNKPKSAGRRGVIRAFVAGVAASVIGHKAIQNVGSIIKNVDEENELFKKYEGKERELSFVMNAIEELLKELEQNNTFSVKMSSTQAPTPKIGILRDFLTLHLQQKDLVKHYDQKFIEELRVGGSYNINKLRILQAEIKFYRERKYYYSSPEGTEQYYESQPAPSSRDPNDRA